MNLSQIAEDYLNKASLMVFNGEADDFADSMEAYRHVKDTLTAEGCGASSIEDLWEAIDDERFGDYFEGFGGVELFRELVHSEDPEGTCEKLVMDCAARLVDTNVFTIVEARREFVSKWRELEDENLALLEG